MAWEKRGHGLYYYRKRREGIRVVSEYIGNDLSAQLISELDRQGSVESREAQTHWREQKSELENIEPDFEVLATLIRGLVRATLLTSGYHPHKGQWRKKRYV